MSINIVGQLDDLIHHGMKFKGAVFLTYSLNLQFFEQLVQPKLDALGCTHVVIISDVFGYQEALIRNLHHLTGVGRRYVVAPIQPGGRGVQHGKVLMLVSEDRGWMLVGSGNLTFSGYGQNLELFDLLEYTETEADLDDASPFQLTWRLIEQLQSSLSKTAQAQLTFIQQYATWLGRTSRTRHDLAVWNSLNEPLIDKIAELGSIDELVLIAPFIDFGAVSQLIEHLVPSKLTIGVDAIQPNIDGKSLESLCQSLGCDLEIRAIHAVDMQNKRALHAKAIIGRHEKGSWCIVGSANITRPALLDHWNAQGNLELVVYRIASNPYAFNQLWGNDLVTSTKLTIQDIMGEIQEPTSSQHREIVRLTNVVAHDRQIQGHVIFRQKLLVQEFRLKLILTDISLIVSLDSQDEFTISLQETLSRTEAAVLEVLCNDGTIIRSAEVFVDQPDELDKYGARSFHRSMRGKLELIQDAAHTFKELMDFLFQRTDRDKLEHEDITRQKRIEQRNTKLKSNFDAKPEVLPVSAFITDDELSFEIGRHIDALHPYDRDHYSLRDLLSLALLRLTTETVPQRTLDASIDNDQDERISNVEIENMQQKQRTWQVWLFNYLVSYFKRYQQRMLDTKFLQKTGQSLLFQNHHTLCRVIMEFHEKSEILTKSKLRETVRQIWAPFFKKNGVLETLEIRSGDTRWIDESLSEIFIVMVATAWSEPSPRLSSDVLAIKRFLYIRRMIARAERYLGIHFWHATGTSVNDLNDLLEPNRVKVLSFRWGHNSNALISRFDKLAKFKTPAEERYEPCARLLQLKVSGKMHSDEAIQLRSYIQQSELKLFGLIENASRIETIKGDQRECPATYVELPLTDLMRLKRGELVESPYAKGVLVYWIPEVDEENDVL